MLKCPLPGNHALTNAWLLPDVSPRSILKTQGNNKLFQNKRTDVLSSNSQCRRNCGLLEKSATAASWKPSRPVSSSVAPCNKPNGSTTINLHTKTRWENYAVHCSMLFMTSLQFHIQRTAIRGDGPPVRLVQGHCSWPQLGIRQPKARASHRLRKFKGLSPMLTLGQKP